MKISERLWELACMLSPGNKQFMGVCELSYDKKYEEAIKYFALLFQPFDDYDRIKQNRADSLWMNIEGEKYFCKEAQIRRFMAILFAYESAKGEKL